MTKKQLIIERLKAIPEGQTIYPNTLADELGCCFTYIYRIATESKLYTRLGPREPKGECRVGVWEHRKGERLVRVPSGLVKRLGDSVKSVRIRYDEPLNQIIITGDPVLT